MYAVKRGHLRVVEELFSADLPAVKASIPTRNADGLNVLHLAVQGAFPEIVAALLKHCDEDLLYVENTVGEAPIETAEIQYILSAIRPDAIGNRRNILTLTHQEYGRKTIDDFQEFADELEKQLAAFTVVRVDLASSGKLAGSATLEKSFDSFELFLVEKLNEARAFIATIETDEESVRKGDESNVVGRRPNTTEYQRKTLEVLLNAARSPRKRSLVHVIDVQQSVINSLNKANARDTDDSPYISSDRARRAFTKSQELPGEIEKEKEDQIEQWRGVLSWGCLQGFLQVA